MKTTRAIGLVGGLLALGAAGAHAQTGTPKVFFACYVPSLAGTTYRIKEPGLSTKCLLPSHVQFSWTDGVAASDHGALNGLADDDHPQYLLTNGARALAGHLNLAGFKLIGLAAGSQAGDAVRFEQAVKVTDAAGGDVSGPFSALLVSRLQGLPLSTLPPADGQVLAWNGTTWGPATIAGAPTGTPANIPGTMVQRDASGGFAAGPVDVAQLNVGGHTTVGGNANVGGSASVGGNASVSGSAEVTGSATVHGPTTLAGLNVGGSAAVVGTMSVQGATSLSTGLTVGGNANIGGLVGVGGQLTAGGMISTADGYRFPDGTVQITAATGGTGTTDHGSLGGLTDDDHPQYLRTDGTRPLSGNLTVTGVGTIGGNLIVGGSSVFSGPITTTAVRFGDGSLQNTAASGISSLTAGSGLTGGTITGSGTIAADFTPAGGDHGAATTVARGDHAHDSRYLSLGGTAADAAQLGGAAASSYLTTGSSAGGDATGPFLNLTVARLQGRPIMNAPPTPGQVLTWTGAAWAPVAAAGGTSANTPNTLVARDGAGGFSAGAVQVNQLTATGDVSAAAFTGNGAGLTGLDANDLTTGTLPSARLSGTYSSAVSLTNSTNSFTGFGSGLTNLNASNLTGTVPSAQLSGTYTNQLVFSNSSNALTGDGTNLANVSAARLQGRSVSSEAPATGQALAWSGTEWTPLSVATGMVAFGTDFALLSPGGSFTSIPGLTRTIAIGPSARTVLIATNGGIILSTNAPDGFSVLEVAVFIDGARPVNGGFQHVVVLNNTSFAPMFQNWSLTTTALLSPATHTIEVRARAVNGNVAAFVSRMQGHELQGTMSVVLLQ